MYYTSKNFFILNLFLLTFVINFIKSLNFILNNINYNSILYFNNLEYILLYILYNYSNIYIINF